MDTVEPPSASNGEVTAEDIDVEILPYIYEILRGIERENADATQKSQDVSQKVLELHKKLNEVRDEIRKLPGIEYNRADQIKQLDTLRKQLRLKRELLLKYRNMCSFEMPKA